MFMGSEWHFWRIRHGVTCFVFWESVYGENPSIFGGHGWLPLASVILCVCYVYKPESGAVGLWITYQIHAALPGL
jgi:hypothetical protein